MISPVANAIASLANPLSTVGTTATMVGLDKIGGRKVTASAGQMALVSTSLMVAPTAGTALYFAAPALSTAAFSTEDSLLPIVASVTLSTLAAFGSQLAGLAVGGISRYALTVLYGPEKPSFIMTYGISTLVRMTGTGALTYYLTSLL